jgi:hypothetical protein
MILKKFARLFCAGKIWRWFGLLLFLHHTTAATATYSAPLTGIITRLHDGLIAQPISKLICSADSWWHNFQIVAPERPTKHQFDKVAIGLPRFGQNRFASLKYFHGLTESISISTDRKCSPNATTYQNTGTLIDSPRRFRTASASHIYGVSSR